MLFKIARLFPLFLKNSLDNHFQIMEPMSLSAVHVLQIFFFNKKLGESG